MDHAIIVPVSISTVLIKMAWVGVFFFFIQTLTYVLTMAVLRSACQNIQGHFVSGLCYDFHRWQSVKEGEITMCVPGTVTEESPCGMTQ